jgi:uncharacterized membrane protein YeaQ/YmgE (transglycosylase-associated protein family)
MVINILLWCLFGLIAGILAQWIMPGKARGFVVTIILGILGAVVGGYLASTLFGWDVNSFSLPGLAVAVGGALLLLFVYRLVMSGAAAR